MIYFSFDTEDASTIPICEFYSKSRRDATCARGMKDEGHAEILERRNPGETRWIVITQLLNKRATIIKLAVPGRTARPPPPPRETRASTVSEPGISTQRSERNPEGCGNCGETVGKAIGDGESRRAAVSIRGFVLPLAVARQPWPRVCHLTAALYL